MLVWVPTFTVEIQRWTLYQIRKNMWRFDHIEGIDDLLQEARLLFWELSEKYPRVTEPANFFALYKTSLLRRFIDKSNIKSRSPVDQGVNADDIALHMQAEPNMGLLTKLLEEMPDELKMVLRDLMYGRTRLTLDRPQTTSKALRENHNKRLKRRLALTMKDPVGDLRSYIMNI